MTIVEIVAITIDVKPPLPYMRDESLHTIEALSTKTLTKVFISSAELHN
jgi:mevalonate pyrophosphate decarboxylase